MVNSGNQIKTFSAEDYSHHVVREVDKQVETYLASHKDVVPWQVSATYHTYTSQNDGRQKHIYTVTVLLGPAFSLDEQLKAGGYK